jgi:predicted Zn-dependent protease
MNNTNLTTNLTLNNVVIESREGDNYVNATQLCKAGGKSFGLWYRLDSTKDLIRELERNLSNLHICILTPLVDKRVGGNHSGSWIHPDLAIQLAQWISPSFAIQVSRWVRELFTKGTVTIDNDSELTRLREELKEKDDRLNRLHLIQQELLTYKKLNTKDETIYICSTSTYARQGIFKIGRSKNAMKFRSANHNITHVGGDKVKVLKEFKVNDSVMVERMIKKRLRGLALYGETEFFLCPYDLLEELLDLIINNDDIENDAVNRLIDVVMRLKEKAFDHLDWSAGIPEDAFKETFTITDGDEKLVEFDVSAWDEQAKQEFLTNCLKEYNTQETKILWKMFQEFMINKLNIPRYKFKASEWRKLMKNVTEEEKIQIKWR